MFGAIGEFSDIGFSKTGGYGSLTPTMFTFGLKSFTVKDVFYNLSLEVFRFGFGSELPWGVHRLKVFAGSTSFEFKDATYKSIDDTYQWFSKEGPPNLNWSDGETVSVRLVASLSSGPTNLTAHAVAPTRVTLRWDRTMPSPSDLDHNAFPGYRIEWSADGNAPWTSLVNVTNQHGTFEHWCVCYGTRFYDNTIAPGTTRYYRVQEVYPDSAPSAYSDVVSATTPALVDSDPVAIDFGAVGSKSESLTDQKVFRIELDAGEKYRFTIAGKATRHRVVVTGPGGAEIWNEVLEANNNLIPRFTTQEAGEHQVKISHGGSPGQYTSLNAGRFHFVLVPERDEGGTTVQSGAPVSAVLNTYGDVDRFKLLVDPGKAYAVRVRGRETGDGTAATPRIKRARPPSTTYVYNMGKPWVDGVTTAASSPICDEFTEPEKCEYQAFVIDLRGQTGAEQTWHIIVAPTARSGTWPYRVGTYQVSLRELSASDLAGVRMPLRAWFASPPAQHDGSNRVKVRVGFSDAVEESPENVGAHGVEVEGGAVTSASAVGGDAPDGAGTRSAGGRNAGGEDREVVWEFEIEPDSDGDLTVTLEAGRPCGEPGAICTADGRALSEGISTTVEGPEAPPPLTASFENMPEAHDGESAFTFRVAFSENIGISYRSLREDAFQVAGGRVTRGRRVDDRRDLFEMTVEPDGEGEVTVTLPAGRECAVSGAICTKGENRRQLTNAPTATVAGPAVETGPAGLTARFVDMPSEHDGKTAFKLRIAFSEEIRMSGRRLRSDVVSVSGGRATKARAVNGRKDLWKLTVRPDSLADVTVTLAGGAACDSPAAVCTADGRALSNTVSTVVRGPVAVSVADARAREGEDETIDFAVSLSRAASGPVTVAYATADRTARAGSDYTRTSGKLSFAAGETELTVRVPVLDDAHDEGEETLVLRLTKASGARIADGEAVGTIENADPLPAAWLARFGRTAGGHVLAAVGERLRGGGQTQATVAGQRLQGADAAAVAEAQAAYERAWAQRLQEGRLQARPRALALRDLVAGSSFSVAAAADAGAAQAASAEPAGRWTVWGRGAWSHFAGNADGGELKLDGDVVTATAGADYERGAVLAGLALAYSTGSGTYDHDSERSGTVESTLLSVHPYARLALHERLAVWGLFGYGLVGHLAQDDAAADAVETGTGLLMGAFGVDGLLLAAAQSGGLELAARADALLLRMSSAAAAGLAASEADLSRWRLLLEASYAGLPLFGGVLSPAVAVGGRYDAGAAETGAGLVLSGRVSYALPAWGLTLSAGGEGLLVHEEEGFREWGAGGSLRFDPGAPGRGLALSVAPSWGVALKRRRPAVGAAGRRLPGAGGGAAVPRRTPRRRAQLRPGRARRSRRPHPLRRRGAGRRRRAHLARGHPPAPRLRPRRQPAGHPRRARLRRPRPHPRPHRIAALVVLMLGGVRGSTE